MSLKSDKWIIEQCDPLKNELPMIAPFSPSSIKTNEEGRKIPSYGVSSYGYDVQMDETIKIYRGLEEQTYYINGNIHIVKPINPQSVGYYSNDGVSVGKERKYFKALSLKDDVKIEDFYEVVENVKSIVIPPNGFILGNTVEHFNMPSRTLGVCIGKSTLARMGILPLVTPLEPNWSGYLTLEIKNLNTVPVEIETHTGIAQINFYRSSDDCLVSYADRGGKYQGQSKTPIDPRL